MSSRKLQISCILSWIIWITVTFGSSFVKPILIMGFPALFLLWATATLLTFGLLAYGLKSNG